MGPLKIHDFFLYPKEDPDPLARSYPPIFNKDLFITSGII